MAQQIGNPLGVFDVGLAAGHGLDVLGICQQQFEATLQQVPVGHRFPIRSGCLKCDVGHAFSRQPIAHCQELIGHRAKRADALSWLAVRIGDQYTRDDRLFVHVQSATPRMHHVHHNLPLDHGCGRSRT